MPNPVPATDPGLPAIPDTPMAAERLHEIHDALVLALDATESANGYTASQREAREHVRFALRHTVKLQEGRA